MYSANSMNGGGKMGNIFSAMVDIILGSLLLALGIITINYYNKTVEASAETSSETTTSTVTVEQVFAYIGIGSGSAYILYAIILIIMAATLP